MAAVTVTVTVSIYEGPQNGDCTGSGVLPFCVMALTSSLSSWPRWVLPSVAVAGALTSLIAIVTVNTLRKMTPRPTRGPGRDPSEDARVSRLMEAQKSDLAEVLGAAIRLETISWDKPGNTTSVLNRSGCANPLHSHSTSGVGKPLLPPTSASDSVTRSALLSFHELLVQRFPRLHASLERHVIGELSLMYVWRGRDASLPASAFYAHLDVVPGERGERDDATGR